LHDVGIIGLGPTGIAASIFLKRAGFDIISFEKGRIGGLLLNAHFVENYPGFPNGISGSELCELMKKHLEKWDIKPKSEKIINISYENDKYTLKSFNKEFFLKTVIIATGTIPRKLNIPGEKKSSGNKIFYEIKDLLPIIKTGDKCVIIGGGDTGFDYALNLAEKSVSVDLFLKSDKPKCLPILKKRAGKKNNIIIHPTYIPSKFIHKNDKIKTSFNSNELIINHSEYSKENFSITSDYVLIACGRTPLDDILQENVEKSNIDGFYFAGDVRTGKFRQVGIAVGEGITAAMKIENYLRGIEK